MPGPTEGQILALEVTERIASVLSLLGCGFIIITFLISAEFRKPINRLAFYAAFGNIITNIATLISTSGIEAGLSSPLCQLQGFIIQMFMPADSLWTLAMACNVYLTFFRKYDAKQLRSVEWKYLVFCYGVPAVPAFTYLFLQTRSLGKVYGNAVLWCWVSKKWDILRVATFYGPVWVVIVTTITIYALAGKEIIQKRRQLQSVTFKNVANPEPPLPSIPESEPEPMANTKTTEVQVSNEPLQTVRDDSSTSSLNEARNGVSETAPTTSGYNQYSVTIECGPRGKLAALGMTPLRRSGQHDLNSAAWSYARVALFFFIALLVTWVPSSVNRVYGLVHPTTFNFPLNYVSCLVLPLQGFWNGIIYVMTSFAACQSLWCRIRGKEVPRRRCTSHVPSEAFNRSFSSKEQDEGGSDLTINRQV